MAKTRKSKEPKLPVGVSKEFVEQLEKSTPAEMKEMVITFQSQIAESAAFLSGNIAVLPEERVKGAQMLQDLKEDYNMAAAPIREAIRHLKNRNKFVMDQLKKDTGI
jgi:hypothetical protein